MGNIVYIIIGLVAGALFGWLIGKLGNRKISTQNQMLRSDNDNFKSDLKEERNTNIDLNSKIATFQNENKNLEEKLINQEQDIEKLQKKFTLEFENLANKIFEEKSEKFTEKNKSNLDNILNPLKENIEKFQKRIENTNESSIDRNRKLFEQIKNLQTENSEMREVTANLTKALKGEQKTQGNWGEIILEKILENSGLRKGKEYTSQAKGMGLKNENGERIAPDVIINLPDKKHLIIDSKVSLVSYTKYVNSEDENKKEQYLSELMTSIKNHIKNLNSKHYSVAKGINSPDFVFLFMPIEGSFALAIQSDDTLFNYAFDKQIVIVSPTTLMAILNTIAFIWRQDNQTKNAKEIAKQSGNLYDKFVGFLEDLNDIGKHLDNTKKSWENAKNKLQTGKGNLIGRVNKIKQLGIKTKKEIPDEFQNSESNLLEE
ncbi:MAG: DNA recombination protein RmuC [Candidatus Marinimicrobia bacterium]|nr:DNA recombination protein RmuC [Candidatus Neomarinimicrobiota bacterium]